MLRAENLEKSYGGKKVVDGLSFEVDPGEIIGLIGPNGAGKTTSFYMTIGLIHPDKGRVIFQDRDVTELPMHERAKMGMGYLAQEPSIFRSLTVEENILCVLERLKLGREEQRRRLAELLMELHLTPLAKKKAGSLSGGVRRRLEITRALVTHPLFLLLDEPFANIDPLAIADLKALIRHLAQKGIAILITDHNAREILSIVNRAYLMREGKLFLQGTPKQLLKSEEAKRYYLQRLRDVYPFHLRN